LLNKQDREDELKIDSQINAPPKETFLNPEIDKHAQRLQKTSS
jgi:hypothetical protein